jgi:hypothetical protein
MQGRAVINWVTAEVAILAMVLLAAAMPGEEDLLIPERRDWAAIARRWLSPAARRLREVRAGREADDYVAALREEGALAIRPSDLTTRKISTVLLTSPVLIADPETGASRPQKAPWPTAPFAPAPGLPMDRPRRAERQPPTLVREGVLPAIRGDLGNYLARMPGYPDE